MLKNKLFSIALLCVFFVTANAQTKHKPGVKPRTKPKQTTVKTTDNSPKTPTLSYETVPNDPYKIRIYTLNNGLKVYLSVYKNAPRIQTFIAVKAGSKNDPPEATGLAHYLEHMVFKGTDKMGTKNFAAENEQITKIENLYETYRNTKDPASRKNIYRKIDSISGIAAKYAIANEYDKLMAGIGAQGTNAFTSFDQTVYINDIPSNQVETWLKIEAERFRKPVLRLFHTELEAVYEEKNRGLDSDDEKVWEALMEGLFQNHTYGTQTTIGTIEHLKNPSMKEIMKFYNNYYVPNNMAIIMSGDFDPDVTITQIEKYFGQFKTMPVNTYSFVPEEPITYKIKRDVYGPNAEYLGMGWRFGGATSKDADMITIINSILSNGKAGLLDLNLNQAQKVLNSGSYAGVLKDYSTHFLFGYPKGGQTLIEVEKLLLEQIELIKKGEFSDWLLQSIITDYKLQKTRQLENNYSRATEIMEAFTNDINWQDDVNTIERLSKITKQEIIDFAKANYNASNYCIVYKHKGEDLSVQKVEKPEITPIEIDKESQSVFAKQISTINPLPIEPVFIDYQKDIKKTNIKSSIPLFYNKNTENLLFDMYYVFDMGSANDKLLPVAIDFLPYVGTSKYTSAQLQEEFYKLGCSFNVFSDINQTWVSLSGLNDNFEKAMQLFETVLSEPFVDELALNNLQNDIVKKRNDQKSNKGIILNKAMYSYAKYGTVNPFTYRLKNEEVEKITSANIADLLKSLNNFEHRILYYGPKELEEVKSSLNTLHRVPESLAPVPAEFEFKELDIADTIYVIDYDMKQVEILALSKGERYNTSILPVVTLYNNYFGGGMSSVVFQDLRESKALAYSAFSTYMKPKNRNQSFYNRSYIGSQSDKLSEAVKGLSDLLNNLPKSDGAFNAAKESVLQEIRSERIIKADVLFNFEEAIRFGFKSDPRKDVFEKVQTMNFDDVKRFHEAYIKGKPTTFLLLGKKSALNLKALEKYGTVKFLTLEEVFGN